MADVTDLTSITATELENNDLLYLGRSSSNPGDRDRSVSLGNLVNKIVDETINIDWKTVGSNIQLDPDDSGKSLWVSEDCTITLPLWDNANGFQVEIIPDGSELNITITTQSGDKLRNFSGSPPSASVTGDAAVTATPTLNTFALHGNIS